MNTDDGIVTDYKDIITPEKELQIRKLLHSIDDEKVNSFISVIRYPASSLHVHLYAHTDIPTAKEQERFLTKLNNKFDRLNKLASEVSEMLDDAPICLKRRAREAKPPINLVQTDMINMMMIINDIDTQKSKYRPEVGFAVKKISEAFNTEFKTKLKIRAFREVADVPSDLPLDELFVPVLAEIINRSVDHAYRLAKSFCPLDSDANMTS